MITGQVLPQSPLTDDDLCVCVCVCVRVRVRVKAKM